jgi:hypothetical protein
LTLIKQEMAQFNATIIAGVLILLTVTGVNESTEENLDGQEIWLRMFIGASITPFIVSSLVLLSKHAETHVKVARVATGCGLVYLVIAVVLVLAR